MKTSEPLTTSRLARAQFVLRIVPDRAVDNRWTMRCETSPNDPMTSGRLPDGLTLDASRGMLDGICQRAGEFRFTLQVTDAAGQRAARDLTLRIEERPTRPFEQARLVGHLHGTDYEKFAPNRDPAFRAAFAQQMKELGPSYAWPRTARARAGWQAQPPDWTT